MNKISAQYEGSHDEHMQKLISNWIIPNLHEYIESAIAVPGESNLVDRRLMNLNLALNAFFDHEALGCNKDARAACEENKYSQINREISNGLRHYKTDSGEMVDSHTLKRVREITAGEGRPTEGLFKFQVPTTEGNVEINQVIAGTLGVILERAMAKHWVTTEQKSEIEELVKKVWPS